MGLERNDQTERSARVRRRLSPNASVWVLIFVIAGAAALLALGPARAFDARAPEPPIHWFLFALVFSFAFAITEMTVVHLHFKRNAHSFSLSELALVPALIFSASAGGLLISQLFGILAVLVFWRRQRPVRLAFNLAQLSFASLVAIVVFANAGPDAAAQDPTTWMWALLAIAAQATAGAVLVFAAISCMEGKLRLHALGRVVGIALVTGLANGSIGLVAAILADVRVTALLLGAVPAAVLFLSYRAYGAERKKHQSMELLFQSSNILNESRELEAAIVSLLSHVRTTFRADVAEILLYAGDEGEVRRTRIGPGDASEVMRPMPYDVSAEPWAGAVETGARLLRSGTTPRDRHPILVAEEVSEAMVGPLESEGRVLGMLLVGDRLGQVGGFDSEDERLFTLLSNQVGVVLENGRLERSLAQLVELERELSHQANHDPLTGLANRTLFRDRVATALARTNTLSAVVFVDLDDFKTVNDSLGHAAGDRLLTVVAERISAAVRTQDITARLGGDEFALLLEGVEDVNEAVEIAQRVLSALRAPVQLASTDVLVQASIGVALSDDVKDVTEILRNADVAMYSAKGEGKGRVDIFEGGMHLQAVARLELKRDLRRAIDRGELSLAYQPVVDLTSGRIHGFEALARWRHPTRGMVAPDRFIPIAEEDGFVVALGKWVLAEACGEAAQWNRTGEDIRVSVNISPRQLRHPDLVADVQEVLRRTGFDPTLLILEVTETVLMEDVELSLRRLSELKRLGVRIAIDDFGTGYSSLSYLQQMPVDLVKIDRSFIEQMGPLVGAILSIAESLKLTTVAEGIETGDQLDELIGLECPYGQGFLFSKPIPPSEVLALLAAGPIPLGSGAPLVGAK